MRKEALRQGASGWVRNLHDGRVEAMVCGEGKIVMNMLEWARRGPPMAKVATLETEEIPEQSFPGFDKLD